MSENTSDAPFPENTSALQLSLPAVSHANSISGTECITGSVRDFSTFSTPAFNLAWLLPSTARTSFQPLVGDAYIYQYSDTTTLSAAPDQSQISTSTLSSLSVSEWDLTGSTDRRPCSFGDLDLNFPQQNIAIASVPTTAQWNSRCNGVSQANSALSLCPTLSSSNVQGTLAQTVNQGYGLSLCCQGGSQAYYYDPNALGSLPSGEVGTSLLPYDTVCGIGSGASAQQPEMVMVLKEIQPANVHPPVPTSAISYSMPPQSITHTGFQVTQTTMEMEMTLGLPPPHQPFGLLPSQELTSSCAQISDTAKPPDFGDIPLAPPFHSPSEYLSLPPPVALGETREKRLDDIKNPQSQFVEAYPNSMDNWDMQFHPLQIPDAEHTQPCLDLLSHRKKPAPQVTQGRKDNLEVEDQGMLEHTRESSFDFADISTLVTDTHLPQLFSSFTDIHPFKDTMENKASNTTTTKENCIEGNPSLLPCTSIPGRQSKEKAHDPLDGAAEAKIQSHNPKHLLDEETAVGSPKPNHGTSESIPKYSLEKVKKVSSRRATKRKGHGKEQNSNKDSSSRPSEEGKQNKTKRKAKEETGVPTTRKKRNQSDLCQDSFKKPRTHLGMHMLEAVQVFHPLGKKIEKKTSVTSSRALGMSSNNEKLRENTIIKPSVDIPHETAGPEKRQVRAQKPDSSALRRCSPPASYELPPPGKVKLVPLPFPSPEKTQARPSSRRPMSLASQGSAARDHARPLPVSTQPTPRRESQRALSGTPWKNPIRAVSSSAVPLGTTNHTRPSFPRSAATRPAPYMITSRMSHHKEKVPAAMAKPRSPCKPKNMYLLDDFSKQPIPWRKVDISGPVISSLITEEQRPEREALKRQAQLDRERAAKYTSLGKLQFFLQRERDMEIAQYYGYAM